MTVTVTVTVTTGSGSGGGHSVLASAMDPSTLAHTYITDNGNFKPAPQPPRKAPTAPKHAKPPAFALLTAAEEEECLERDLAAGQEVSMAEGELPSWQSGKEAVGEEEGRVEAVMRQWFKEQKHFQENVALRRQHAHLLKRLAKLQQHLLTKQKQQAAKSSRQQQAVLKKRKPKPS